jgi:hypothetical protein
MQWALVIIQLATLFLHKDAAKYVIDCTQWPRGTAVTRGKGGIAML